MRRLFARLRPLLLLVLGATLPACADNALEGPAGPVPNVDELPDVDIQPSYAIVDGSSPAGNPHFHWLHPISSSYDFAGVFDGSLVGRVTVEICVLSGDDCSGGPIRTFSSSAVNYWDQIRVSVRRQYYLVYWSSAGTDPATDYRIRVLLDGQRELGHADVDVVPSYGDLGSVASDFVGVALGSWLPITFRLEVGVDDAETPPSVVIEAPADGAEVGPGPADLVGSASDAEDGDLSASIAWTSSQDGPLGTGATVRATLTPGPHVLTAAVTDAGGTTEEASVAVTVRENQAPVVSISSPLDGETTVEGTDVVLAATAADPDGSEDPTPGIVWTAEPALPGLTPGPALTVQPAPGTYTLTATATDALGATGSASVTLTVTPDEAPVVSITAPADGASFQEGQTASFSATATDAVDGVLSAGLVWTSDLDGPLGSGASVDAALSVGSHVVTASVTDSRGSSASASITVTVAPNTPPAVTIASPADGASVVEGISVSLTASATDAQDGDLSAGLAWTSDLDGPLGAGPSVTSTLSVGSHTLTATATDVLGATGSASVTLTVTPDEAPVVSITAPADGASFQEGETASFSATATDAVDGDLSADLVWMSDLDGPLGSGASVDTGLSVGSHVVTASVTDSRGSTASASITVTVAPNTPPAVTIASPADGAVFGPDDAITLTATADDAEEGDLSGQIQWTSDRDGTLGQGSSLSPSLSGGSHRISATVTDGVGATATAGVDILVGIVGVQQTVVVPFSGDASLPITLAEPAPPSGLTLTITSSDPSVVEPVTSTVTVASGARATNALLHGIAPGTATISVTTPNLGGGTSEAEVSGRLSVSPTTLSFAGGVGSGTLTVETFSGDNPATAPPGGLVVTLASADATCAAVPATATIPAGQGGVEVEVTYGGTATLPCATTVQVSAEFLDPASASVNISEPSGIEIPEDGPGFRDGVGSGLMTSASGSLSTRDHGGVLVTLASDDPSTLLLSRDGATEGTASITVPVGDGSDAFGFMLHGVEGQTGAVTVTASADGFAPVTGTVEVLTPVIRLTEVPGTREVFGSDTRPRAQLGILSSTSSAFRPQAPRVGWTPPAATFTTSDQALARFVVGTDSYAASVDAAWASDSGEWERPTLQAVAPGTVTIGVSAPGFTPFEAERDMTLIGSDISANDGTVAAGLMAPFSGSLSARPYEDTPVTITSDDPSKILVSLGTSSSDGSPVAGATATATVGANGFLRFSYWIHALEGATGTATYTVTAPGYAAATRTITLAEPGFTIGASTASGGGSLTHTIETFEDLTYHARIGAVTGSSISNGSRVRSDSPAPPTLTLTSSDPAVGGFDDPASGGVVAAVSVPFPPGSGTLSVPFRPVDPGVTTVTITNPAGDLQAQSATSGDITVVGTPINASDQVVGAGLMERVYFALSQYAPEDVTVTITSADPSVVEVGSFNYGTPSTSTSTLVRAGYARFGLALHGIRQGTTTVTVEAPGYGTAVANVTVVQPTLSIFRGLNRSPKTFDDDDPFQIWVGRGSGNSFTRRPLRTGNGSLTVTVTNSDPDVGELVAGSQRGQSVTVVVPEGGSILSDAVAFSPGVNGSTEITLSAPGFIQRPGETNIVTVQSPSIAVAAPSRVGAGLYLDNQRILLGPPYGSPHHGGVTVTVESSDPSRVLVGPTDGTSAAGTYSVFVPDGQTDVRYAIHGEAGTTATNVQIRVTADGFLDGTASVDVIQPSFRIRSLGSSQSAGGSDTFEFLLEAGTYEYQRVRDPAGLPVTVESSDPTVALVSADGSTPAATATFVVPQGEIRTGTVFRLDGVAPGIITLTTSAPSFADDSRFITVN